eukprot:scaffold584429_cov47-Prasinocladus_malaysianus.AAC.1
MAFKICTACFKVAAEVADGDAAYCCDTRRNLCRPNSIMKSYHSTRAASPFMSSVQPYLLFNVNGFDPVASC